MFLIFYLLRHFSILGQYSLVKIRVGDEKKYNNIGPFSGRGLEKPIPARTIDTLADGS